MVGSKTKSPMQSETNSSNSTKYFPLGITKYFGI